MKSTNAAALTHCRENRNGKICHVSCQVDFLRDVRKSGIIWNKTEEGTGTFFPPKEHPKVFPRDLTSVKREGHFPKKDATFWKAPNLAIQNENLFSAWF